MKALSIEEYLNKSRPFLKDIINSLHKPNRWKIHLTIATNLMSSKEKDEKHEVHSKSYNIKIIKF